MEIPGGVGDVKQNCPPSGVYGGEHMNANIFFFFLLCLKKILLY